MRGVSNRAKWCPRFQDLKISLGSQDFYGISIYGFRDFYGIYGISMGLFPVFYGNNRNKYIAWISQARFQLGFQHLRPRFQLVADPSDLCRAIMQGACHFPIIIDYSRVLAILSV